MVAEKQEQLTSRADRASNASSAHSKVRCRILRAGSRRPDCKRSIARRRLPVQALDNSFLSKSFTEVVFGGIDFAALSILFIEHYNQKVEHNYLQCAYDECSRRQFTRADCLVWRIVSVNRQRIRSKHAI